MKTITIAGNITKDAVLRRTQSGDPVTGFSVAVNDSRTKQPTYFDCSIWGKRGDALVQYLKKGAKVCVAGDLGTREHDGRTYLTINANEVSLMGGLDKQRDAKPDNRSSYDQDDAPGQTANFSRDLDDDIPFAPEFR